MPSRADAIATPAVASDTGIRVIGALLQFVAVLCMCAALFRLMAPRRAALATATVRADGTLSVPLEALLTATGDTVELSLSGVPSARTRASLRALRASGRVLRLVAPEALPARAIGVESEWASVGGTRVSIAGDTGTVALRDAAGDIDSVPMTGAGVQLRSGPVQGAVMSNGVRVHAAAPSIAAGAPTVARVLVVGEATWESKFLIAALEEQGWPVDAAVTVSPKVIIAQGSVRSPSLARHAVVVVLPGAPTSALAALPGFVRGGGGLVIVGEAARSASLASLRAGAPGVMQNGIAGAESSPDPRRGLDVTPIGALADGAVLLESRGSTRTIAARRVGAGRVVQVGYDNSWLWRMGGPDGAAEAHRRWWNALVAGVVAMRAPIAPAVTPATDTLDAAPLAALSASLGLPEMRAAAASPAAAAVMPTLDLRWLLGLALLSLVASVVLRRWRGFS